MCGDDCIAACDYCVFFHRYIDEDGVFNNPDNDGRCLRTYEEIESCAGYCEEFVCVGYEEVSADDSTQESAA